jgi:hypothetical protein
VGIVLEAKGDGERLARLKGGVARNQRRLDVGLRGLGREREQSSEEAEREE